MFALLATSFWMVPAALDLAVQDDRIAILKVISVALAGLSAGASWTAAGIVIQAFFVFNWFWMTFAVGLLYREAPQQLCSVYLPDEQADAGLAMMAWAMAGLVLWASTAIRQIRLWDQP